MAELAPAPDDLPPVPHTKRELQKSLNEAADANGRSPGKRAERMDKVSDIVQQATASMKSTWKKLDDKVPEDNCGKKCTAALRDLEDPVRSAKCSTSRCTFLLVTLAGAVFAIIEAAMYDSIADLVAGILLFLMGLFVTVFLGGDIFMFEAFRKVVNGMAKQIRILKRSLAFYGVKLNELSDVREGLEHVYREMDGDVRATAQLLADMERLGKLQTVSAVVNQFYAADYEGKGVISGMSAELLFPQITILWDIVPGYDKELVIEHVREKGMTLQQFFPIIDALVQENQALCIQALENLVGKNHEDVVWDLLVKEESKQSLVPQDGDVEAPPPPTATLEASANHCAGPPAAVVGQADGPQSPIAKSSGATKGPSSRSHAPSEESTSAEALQPLVTVPTCIPNQKWGLVEFGGDVSIWGIWHLVAVILLPICILVLIFCIVEGEIHNILLAVVLNCLSFGLVGTGKLIEVLKALRQQIKDLAKENDHLRSLNAGLADQVAKLDKLKQGWMKLQELCAGSTEKARELLTKSHHKVKMEAMAVCTHLFKHHDNKRQFKLQEAEKEDFFQTLEGLFHGLPGWNMVKIREIVGPGNMDHNKIREIVDVIAAFDSSTAPPVDPASAKTVAADPGAAYPC